MTDRPRQHPTDPETLKALHRHFEAAVLPRVERHVRIYFGQYRRNPEMMEELTQQAVANAWKSYLAIVENGRSPDDFLNMIAVRACQGVRFGRKIQGMEKSSSVSNPLLQQREGFRMEALPASTAARHEQLYGLPGGPKLHDEVEERLRDNPVTPPPEQAAFRLDYPTWLVRLGRPKRDIAEDLAAGETTQSAAEKHKKSEGRISQLRREFHKD